MVTPGAAAPLSRSGSASPQPRVRAFEAVGERFADEIARRAAWFQQDADGWGVTAVVDRPRPAAFSCDQDLVLRQAMADRGWAAPQFVAEADLAAAAVELPRYSTVAALGGAVGEPARRRVWHVSSVGMAPVPPRTVVTGAGAVEHVVRAVARAAGVRLAVGGSLDVLPSVLGRGLTCVVSHPVRGSGDGTRWASSLLRAVVSALAASRLVGQVVQLQAFERFVLRAMRRGGEPGRSLGEAYRAVAVAPGPPVLGGVGAGARETGCCSSRARARSSWKPDCRGCGSRSRRCSAWRRSPAPQRSKRRPRGGIRWRCCARPAWAARVASRAVRGRLGSAGDLVSAVAAKRVAERLGLPYVPGRSRRSSRRARAGPRFGRLALGADRGRNLAGWLVDGVRGRPVWPAALE